MEHHTLAPAEVELLRSLRGRHLDELWYNHMTSGLVLGEESIVLHAVPSLNEENCRDWYELFRLGLDRQREVEKYQDFMTCFHRRLGVIEDIRVGTGIVSDWSDEREQEIAPRLLRYGSRAEHLVPDESLDTYVTHPECGEDLAVLERAGLPVASLPVGLACDLDNGFSAVFFTEALGPRLEYLIVPRNAHVFSESVVAWASIGPDCSTTWDMDPEFPVP